MDNKHPALLPGAMVIVILNQKQLPGQKFLIVFDKNDRDRADGIHKGGLPGGGQNSTEKMVAVARRELFEETGLVVCEFGLLGVFPKRRYPSGKYVGDNENYVFIVILDKEPTLGPIDVEEVSACGFYSIAEILQMWEEGRIHEGSLRILLIYLLDPPSGYNLSDPVEYNGKKY